jgi:hypothetical protein
MGYIVLEQFLAQTCYKATQRLRSNHYAAPSNQKKALAEQIHSLVEQTAKDMGQELPQGWKKVCPAKFMM